MGKTIIALGLLVLFPLACGQGGSSKARPVHEVSAAIPLKTDTHGETLENRFEVPVLYERIALDSPSFARYFGRSPLKSPGAVMISFNGETKPNRGVYEAVVDLPIGKRDLHQCTVTGDTNP